MRNNTKRNTILAITASGLALAFLAPMMMVLGFLFILIGEDDHEGPSS